MSEMVERVAKAMCLAGHNGRQAWDDISKFQREAYIRDTRAAIAAMREPTEAILTVGEDVIFDGDHEYELEELAKLPNAWRAMIDEALR